MLFFEKYRLSAIEIKLKKIRSRVGSNHGPTG